MVKVTSSILVGAALFASTSTLAAPTRFKRSSAEVAASTDLLDANDESDLVEEATGALGLDQQTGSVGPMIADALAKRDGKRSGSDAIRRGLPLTPESASDLAKRESVVAKLGLTGALAPLGVGPLIPTVQGLVDGLPVVGGPVGGLVKTVDTTVGLTDLLNKPKAKRDLLSGLMGSTTDSASGALGGLSGLKGLTGGLTSGLPLGGALDTGSSTINGLLGQLQGAGASSSQLAGVLGQLQGLGLGNLPLSALTGSATPSSSSSSTGSTQQNQAASTPSAASVQQATSILQGLTVAQAEQYGLLPSGTTGKVLTQIESAAAAQASANNLASSFTSRTYGFKAQGGGNGTMSETDEDQGGATPTFAIASPDAVASAILGGGSASNSTTEPSSTSAAEMSKRTMMPASGSSSMTPAASSTAASSTKKPAATSDSMEDSGSDYSEDDEDDDDSDMESDTEEPVTPTATAAPLARRGGPLEDNGEPESDMSKKKESHGGMEGQGPHASGAWHATDSSSMAHTQSQAVATAEAMTYTYSDASATAVPTTAPSKRSYADLD